MKNRRIVVLGSRGMLGQMAVRYFSRSAQVIAIDDRYTWETRREWLGKVSYFRDSYVINCIGRIKQKNSASSELFNVNTLLPLDLCDGLHESQTLIHPSTDCVYTGVQSAKWYRLGARPDAKDEYGSSKRLAECALGGKRNVFIIRVSIIGIDGNHYAPRGLLGWFLSQADGSDLKGYADHYWNGITTLQWCRFVEDYILSGRVDERRGTVLQLGTIERHSKYDMLRLFQSVFGTQFIINSTITGEGVNRAMEPEFLAPPLRTQLEEMKQFWYKAQ